MELNDIQLVIPACGIGKRFIDAGYTTPKFLLEVDNFPIIKHIIDMFPGVSDISLITNLDYYDQTNKIVKKYYPEILHLGIEKHKKGPVYTVNKVKDWINDNKPVIVAYCDCFSSFNFNEWLLSIGDNDGSVLANKGFHPIMLGNDAYAVCFHKNNGLAEIKEKHSLEDKFSEFNSTGVYFFKSGAILKKYFKELIDKNVNIKGEYYVSLVYNLMIKDGLKSNVYEVDNVINLGVPLEYEEYKQISEYFWNKKFNKQCYYHDENTTLIFPMAGDGIRFKDKYKEPKPLIKIDNKPMFSNAISSIPNNFGRRIVVIQKKHAEQGLQQEVFNHFSGKNKTLILSEKTEGQACTIEKAIKECNVDLEKPILIGACDFMLSYDKNKYSDLIEDKTNDIIAFSFRNVQSSKIRPESYAWMELDRNNCLKKLFCKKYPFEDSPSKHHVFMGVCFFRKAKYFLDAYKYNIENNIRTGGEFYLDDMLNTCINQGLKIKIFECNHYFALGTPQDLKVYEYWHNYFSKKFRL